MTDLKIGKHSLIADLPDNPQKWNAKRPLVMFGEKRTLKPELVNLTWQELEKKCPVYKDRFDVVPAMMEWDGYANSYYRSDDPKHIWMDFVPGTKMTLELLDWDRGRSAVTYWWEDVETKVRYPMFGKDMYETVRKAEISGGRVTAEWYAVKRGANYGVSLVGPKTPIKKVKK